MQTALAQSAHPSYQQCVRCVMDSSDPNISFDEHGVCSHCHYFDTHIKFTLEAAQRGDRMALLEAAFEKIRRAGRGRRYDCVLGVSGGVDSTYLAWVAKQRGLRVLLVHCDSGWNSELAVKNIEQIAVRLQYDLHTVVVGWQEMKDLQRAFFLASQANCDIPQDHAYIASVYHAARAHGIGYILNGSNFATESILPEAWGYNPHDLTHLRAVHAHYGKRPLTNYPVISFWNYYVVYPLLFRIRTVRPLNDMPYVKSEAKEILMRELGWRDYGAKHYESVFTKFFQSYYLVEKFGYDKRKAHVSSLVLAGQMPRADALKELQTPSYDAKTIQQDIDYVIKKLDFTLQEWEAIMCLPARTYKDFDSDERLFTLKTRLRAYWKNRRRAV